LVKQTPNAIGYIELVYAVQNKLAYAEIKNRGGKFVTPTLESVTAAAAAATIPTTSGFRSRIHPPPMRIRSRASRGC
jgi:phosphate transport system substrate-binding protein